jgi:acetyltransferase
MGPVPTSEAATPKAAATAKLRTGQLVSIRPIRPDDEAAMVRFHKTLSDESVYSRYFGLFNLPRRVEHGRLARLCLVDPDMEIALIAESAVAATGLADIVGVARLIRLPGTRRAEFALVVSDAFQGQYLGSSLLMRIIEAGRGWGLDRIVAMILPDNYRMRRICAKQGFTFHGMTGAVKVLQAAPD